MYKNWNFHQYIIIISVTSLQEGNRNKFNTRLQSDVTFHSWESFLPLFQTNNNDGIGTFLFFAQWWNRYFRFLKTQEPNYKIKYSSNNKKWIIYIWVSVERNNIQQQ